MSLLRWSKTADPLPIPEPGNLLSKPKQAPPAKPLPEMREMGDVQTARKWIYEDVLGAAQNLPAISNNRHTLKLTNARYIDPEDFSKADQKHAILTNKTMGRRIRGTWQLLDNESGKVLDQRDQVVARVPYLTARGTFIHNGTSYGLRNQQRLSPGVFVRKQANGDIEAHANILPGNGAAHRYYLDPSKGTFNVRIHQANVPLMPLLRLMGSTDKELRDAWGPEVLQANVSKDDPSALRKFHERILSVKDRQVDNEEHKNKKLVEAFESMALDPFVSKRTLGSPHERLNKAAILDTTKKLLGVARGTHEVDDRDNLAYQRFMTPENLFSERLTKDYGKIRRQLLFKASLKGHLGPVAPGALTEQLESALTKSGLGTPLEEANVSEVLDKLHSITRMGEGGIESDQVVPDEARSVQPSHLGFYDPVRTPESNRAGVDVYLSSGVRKGRDGNLYAQFKDPRTGQMQWKTPKDVADETIAFPDQLSWPTKRIPVIQGGKHKIVKKRDVTLVAPHPEHGFSPLGNIVPFKSAMKAQRLAMGARMSTQALPLTDAESPLVQTGVPDQPGRSYEDIYGEHMGAIRAKKAGRVIKSDDDKIHVMHDDGTQEVHDLYNNFPLNRKTFLHQSSVVTPGQQFAPGDLLARSNYTDPSGSTALGLNLRTAYYPMHGHAYEDAIVLSESASKRLQSEHAYQHAVEPDEKTRLGKNNYAMAFPGRYDRKVLDAMDEDGVVKPGTIVEHGHPLILAAREKDRSANKIHRKGEAGFSDRTETWDHHDQGVVTDVVKHRNGPVVVVKSLSQMQEADKLSGRYGNKGVVRIMPDSQMPHDAEGRPFEVVTNPLGVISRANPNQMAELALGKIAAKTGRPYKEADFKDGQEVDEFARQELAKHGMSSTEEVYDPVLQRKIPGIATGNMYWMKLHHMAEHKGQGRGGGSYSAEDAPTKGGPQGAKRMSLLDMSALNSHGVPAVQRDATVVRGQKNDDWWLQFMEGHTPDAAKVPTTFQKFISTLQASGINVVPKGQKLHAMAMTNSDVKTLAGDREIQNGDTVHFDKDLAPVKGGLFDPQLTGGHHGGNWASIKLHEPMLNPVMAEPARRLLGLTEKKFDAVIAGKEELEGGTGPAAINKALSEINVDKELEYSRAQIAHGTKAAKDAAVRKLGYLKHLKAVDLHPKDWVLTHAPVLPPRFRPVSVMADNGTPLVADVNYLYKELFDANKNLKDMTDAVGPDNVAPEREALYKAFEAVSGLGDPVGAKSQKKGVKGLLKGVFGSSPKFGAVQRRLISSTVDHVGRAVVTPNPDLDMDELGIPEDRAFDVYNRFVARRMRRAGMPLSRALQEIKDKSPLARKYLDEEMADRPVIMNRAPVLHRWGIMAFYPRLTKGSAVQVSPLVTKGFNMDFDGDAVQYHVPATDEAKEQAIERMLPSRNLIAASDFKTPVHAPQNEYVHGLYYASTSKSSRRPRIFRNRADVMQALARNEIAHNDPVEVLDG